jgi:hypothetical protein
MGNGAVSQSSLNHLPSGRGRLLQLRVLSVNHQRTGGGKEETRDQTSFSVESAPVISGMQRVHVDWTTLRGALPAKHNSDNERNCANQSETAPTSNKCNEQQRRRRLARRRQADVSVAPTAVLDGLAAVADISNCTAFGAGHACTAAHVSAPAAATIA